MPTDEEVLDAVLTCEPDKVKAVLAAGGKGSAKKANGTALTTAISRCSTRLEVSKLLIDKGADVNAKDRDEVTVLKEAEKVNQNKDKIMEFLKSKGAK